MKLGINPLFILLIAFFTFYVQGCNNTSRVSFENSIGIPIQDFIEISIWDSPTIMEDDINLYIQNKTRDCIVFPNDYGVKILFQQEGIWASLPDLVKSPNPDMITLGSIDSHESDAVLFIRPDYERLDKRPVALRILLTAYLCDNGTPTNELIGDYVDINIQ